MCATRGPLTFVPGLAYVITDHHVEAPWLGRRLAKRSWTPWRPLCTRSSHGTTLRARPVVLLPFIFSFLVPGLAHVSSALIELRLARISYQDYHMLLPTLRGPSSFSFSFFVPLASPGLLLGKCDFCFGASARS